MEYNRVVALAVVILLAGLLNGCRVASEPKGHVHDPELTTNRQIDADGPFVICRNLETTVTFSATVNTGSPEDGAHRSLYQVRQFFLGPETGVIHENHVLAEDAEIDGNDRFTVTTTFGPEGELAPLDTAAQTGTTLVRYEVFLNLGDSIFDWVWHFPMDSEDHVVNGDWEYYEIPVWNNCSAD